MQGQKKDGPPQSSLILRVLGGGYLVYLAWDLFSGSQGNPMVWAAAAVFALVGGVLLIASLRTLVKSEYFYDKPESEETE